MNVIFLIHSLFVYLFCIINIESKILWSDEFNGGTSLTNNWRYDIGGSGWGNNEWQYYTDNRWENSRMENGNLIIEARKEWYGGKDYTSARMLSRRTFKYGILEIRAKLPRGRGTWPAFWLLQSKSGMQWPRDGEIDVMEHVGYDPGVVHATIHCGRYNWPNNNQKSGTIRVNDPYGTFHTYTLDWSSDRIKMFVDGQQFFEYRKEDNSYDSWPFDNEFFVILNTAIGGDWGAVQGVDNSIFPTQYVIDYVRYCDASGCQGGGVSGQINWQGDWALACDFNGNDIARAHGPGEQCSNVCRNTGGCTHYTWNNFEGGTCWMKGGSVSKNDAIYTGDEGMVCGLLGGGSSSSQISWQGNWAFACDFTGNDIASAQVPGDQCSNVCRNTAGCTHFSWTNLNGGTCWMKRGSVSKSDAIFNGNYDMVCGIL